MVARFLIRLILLYQRIISPHMNCCVFVESCSSFGIAVLKERGAIRGCYWIILRLLACQSWLKMPWYDAVVCSHRMCGRK